METTTGRKLSGVRIASPTQLERYEVGELGVTAIEWGQQNGPLAAVPTIVVYRHGKLWSEHPFHNVLSVYFSQQP